MSDTRKEYQDWLDKCPLTLFGGEFQVSEIAWQACQSLNDKRIEQLLAVIEFQRNAMQEAVDCGMVPTSSAKEGGAARHSQYIIVADKIRSALALQPADVELVEVGVVDWDYDQGGMATCQYANITQSFKIKPATKLYTIKTKARTK